MKRSVEFFLTVLLSFMYLIALTPVSYGQEKKTEESTPLFPVVKDIKWGYIDKTGKLFIQPQFEFARNFSEGLAVVKIGEEWGFIDKTGKIVIEPQFDWAWEFSGGLARIRIGGKYGYIDKTGKYVWEPTN